MKEVYLQISKQDTLSCTSVHNTKKKDTLEAVSIKNRYKNSGTMKYKHISVKTLGKSNHLTIK